MESLSSLANRVHRATGAWSRIEEVLERPVVVNRSGGLRWPTLQGDIALNDVHFRYDTRPHVPVLKGVSLTAPKGKVIALCGASGSGKSTIASLLLGYYAPQPPAPAGGDGAVVPPITVDGRPLSQVDLQWYRKHVAYVPQDAALFSTTIRDNILYGNDQVRTAMPAVTDSNPPLPFICPTSCRPATVRWRRQRGRRMRGTSYPPSPRAWRRPSGNAASPSAVGSGRGLRWRVLCCGTPASSSWTSTPVSGRPHTGGGGGGGIVFPGVQRVPSFRPC